MGGPAAAGGPAARRGWQLPSALLFALAVLVWGTTWHAILYQIDLRSPAYGVTWRFALAALLMLAVAAWRGDRLRLPWRAHRLLLLQGAFMYALAYLCVYQAERHVPSGLVAVGYSASPLLAGLGAWLLWRQPLSARFGLGGALGIVGVAMIFQPELAAVDARPTAALGVAFAVAAVLLSAVGALAAVANPRHGVTLWPALGWGMAYGAAIALGVLLLQEGWPLPAPPAVASWWLSLAYLSAFGTVLAFACFLTLQQRLGPGPAGTVGVATPVVALLVSALAEGWQATPLALAGVALAVLGNVLMLLRRGGPALSPAAASRAAE